MRTWAHWTAKTVMLTAAFAAASAGVSGVALAGTGAGGSTSGDGSVLGGNQALIPVSIPANVCGNAAALLGLALAGCQGGASVRAAQIGSGSASGNGSVGGGNQVAAPVTGPVDVCGNVAAVLGDSAAGCEGTAAARTGGSPARPEESSGSGGVSDPAIGAVTRTSGARGGSRGRGGRTATPHQGTAMAQSPAYQGAERGLAVLGAPPVPTGTPDLTDLAAPSAAGGLPAGSTAVRNAMPASALAADTAPGMGSASFYSLAIGALMAGAVALKMAGRRIRGRKA
jgi:ChpA-C